MKIMLLVLIFVGVIYLGISINNYYNNRKKFFKEFHNFLEYLKLHIVFQNTKLKNLVEDFESKCQNKHLRELLSSYYDYLGNLDKNNEIDIDFKIITNEEKLLINKILLNLGRLSCGGEVASISNAVLDVKTLYDSSSLTHQKFGPMSIKLSISLGLLFIIILI